MESGVTRRHVTVCQSPPVTPLVAHCGGFGSRLARLALAGVGLALALHAGRLVMLAPLGLGEQPVLLHPAGKLLQRGLEGVTVSNNNLTHAVSSCPGSDLAPDLVSF